MLVAVLPACREDDLRAGASAEAGTTPFWIASGGKNRSRRFCCPRGVTKAKQAKLPVPGEKRHRGVAQQHGDDKTPFFTGCKVAYSSTKVGDRVVIKLSSDALDHNHDTFKAARYVPAWVRDSIRKHFVAAKGRKLNAENIAAEINATAQDEALLLGGFDDMDDAIKAWLTGEALPPRDAFVDAKYVQDLLRRLARDKDEMLYNEEEAVAAWVDSVGDDVFYYSPGSPSETDAEEDVRLRAARVTILLQYCYNTGV